MRLECRFIDAFPQLPRPEGARLNLLPGLLSFTPFLALFSYLFPLPPPFLRLCRLSGFSTPLTTLSRKYVNVHACPIIRSSRSLFSLRSFVPSVAIFRSIFLPYPTRVPLEPRSIDPRARVTNSRRAAIRARPCLGNEKTIDSTMLRPRGRPKRKVRRENARRGSERKRDRSSLFH